MNELDSKVGGMLFIFIGIGITSWMGMARQMRGQVLSLREKEYVEAARCLGAGNLSIMFRHILPNAIGPLIVLETLAIPGYISYEAFLSFIGLGVNPPTPSWGIMISDGARLIRSYPHTALVPRGWRWPSPCSPSTSWATACATRWTRACGAPASQSRSAQKCNEPVRSSDGLVFVLPLGALAAA